MKEIYLLLSQQKCLHNLLLRQKIVSVDHFISELDIRNYVYKSKSKFFSKQAYQLKGYRLIMRLLKYLNAVYLST